MLYGLKLSVFGTNDDIFFAVVYVPQHESRFNTADEMSLFDAEISSMCVLHKYVILITRTHNKPDFIDVDDVLNSHFEFDGSFFRIL